MYSRVVSEFTRLLWFMTLHSLCSWNFDSKEIINLYIYIYIWVESIIIYMCPFHHDCLSFHASKFVHLYIKFTILIYLSSLLCSLTCLFVAVYFVILLLLLFCFHLLFSSLFFLFSYLYKFILKNLIHNFLFLISFFLTSFFSHYKHLNFKFL